MPASTTTPAHPKKLRRKWTGKKRKEEKRDCQGSERSVGSHDKGPLENHMDARNIAVALPGSAPRFPSSRKDWFSLAFYWNPRKAANPRSRRSLVTPPLPAAERFQVPEELSGCNWFLAPVVIVLGSHVSQPSGSGYSFPRGWDVMHATGSAREDHLLPRGLQTASFPLFEGRGTGNVAAHCLTDPNLFPLTFPWLRGNTRREHHRRSVSSSRANASGVSFTFSFTVRRLPATPPPCMLCPRPADGA